MFTQRDLRNSGDQTLSLAMNAHKAYIIQKEPLEILRKQGKQVMQIHRHYQSTGRNRFNGGHEETKSTWSK